MIKSRRPVEDPARSCARCKHLKQLMINHKENYSIIICGIDAKEVPDRELLTMTTCDKYKGVK